MSDTPKKVDPGAREGSGGSPHQDALTIDDSAVFHHEEQVAPIVARLRADARYQELDREIDQLLHKLEPHDAETVRKLGLTILWREQAAVSLFATMFKEKTNV